MNKNSYPPIQNKYQNNHGQMQGSAKHLHFLSAVTGILADTFADIHRLLKDQVSLPTSTHALEEHPLSISNSNSNSPNNQNGVEKEEEEEVNGSPQAIEPTPNGQSRPDKKKKTAKWQAEGKPRPPLNAFMLFLKASKSEIMQARPELTPAEVSTYASSLWGELANDEKQKYRNEYRENRNNYRQMMEEYHKATLQAESQAGRNKRGKNPRIEGKASKKDGKQEVVNIESDEDNSCEI